MYVLVSKVGCNYGILDTDDGALDWVTLETIQSVVSKGTVINGVSSSGLTPQDCFINQSLCNWANGQNVFAIGRGLVISQKGAFKFLAGKKAFKGKVVNTEGGIYTLRFNFGVVTKVADSTLKGMLHS